MERTVIWDNYPSSESHLYPKLFLKTFADWLLTADDVKPSFIQKEGSFKTLSFKLSFVSYMSLWILNYHLFFLSSHPNAIKSFKSVTQARPWMALSAPLISQSLPYPISYQVLYILSPKKYPKSVYWLLPFSLLVPDDWPWIPIVSCSAAKLCLFATP